MKHYIRSGLSLIELLVVIAILSVLIGLTLSAVQHVRSAAARTACANNLRQTGLALQNYHATVGAFPTGVVSPSAKNQPLFMTWQTRLLPYLEQNALWETALGAYRAQPSPFFNPPHTALATTVKIYVCPADSRVQEPQQDRYGRTVAFTSYLGITGANWTKNNGILFVDSVTRISDVTDGTSQTLLVGERPPSADLDYGWWYTGAGQQNDGVCDSVMGVAELNNYAKCPFGPYRFEPGRTDNQCDMFHYWSLHKGGAHFLFADGSLHFIRYSADGILPALATRAGGESVELP